MIISSLSTIEVWVNVAAKIHGSVYDPTADPVFFAFIPLTQSAPLSTDWKAATWDSPAPTVHNVTLLIGGGPGGTLIPIGTYAVYVKIVDNPEIVVTEVDELTVQ